MSTSCPQCEAELPEACAVCPDCGHHAADDIKAHGRVGVFPENIAGALAYVSCIPAIVFLLLEPYRRNRFVRFHSLQCLFLCLTMFVIAALLKLAEVVLYNVPVLGHLLVFLIAMVFGLAALVLWLVLVIKALQGEAFKVLVIGDWAQRQASAGIL